MNDKNIRKRQLPLKLALNMNRNKETIDSSFSTASCLKNAPIYNNAISHYFKKYVENDGPTIYDENNNSFTVNANGDVISGSVPLFKIDLNKFVKEDVSFDENMVSFDAAADAVADANYYVSVIDSDSYLAIDYCGTSYTMDISEYESLLAAKAKIFSNKTAVITALLVNSSGNTVAKVLTIDELGNTFNATESIKWYNKGTIKQLSELTVSSASSQYKDLEALYNNSISQYNPLIQIADTGSGTYGISFLLKKGLVTDDDFTFSYLYISPTNSTISTVDNTVFTFTEGEIVEVTVDVKLQIALLAEGPFHYMDLQGADNKTYEVVPAGSYIKAFARSVTPISYPISLKINYTWPATPGGSSFVTGLGNLPIKYGRRKYNNGAYTVQGGDNKTNFNYASGLNYTDILPQLPSVGIDASSTSWNETQTERLEYDTQVAAINKYGNATSYLTQRLDGGSTFAVAPAVARNQTKPTITSIDITLNNSTKTITVNSQDHSFVYFDPFSNCDRDQRADFRVWFSNSQKYSDGTHNIYPNNSYEQKYIDTNWPGLIQMSEMPKSRMDDYVNDFGRILTSWSAGQSNTYSPVWCYHRVLDATNPIINTYTTIFSDLAMAHSMTDYNTLKSAASNRFIQGSFIFQQQVGFAGSFSRHPMFLSSNGNLFNSDYRSFNSNESDAYAVKAHIDSITNTDTNGFTISWIIDKSINVNPEQVINKYHKGNVRFIDDGVFAQTIAYSNPTIPYSDESPTNGQDWSDDDKWYFVYYDSCFDKLIANPGVIAKECQVSYGSAFYSLNKYYHTNGMSVSNNRWNVLFNSSTDGASISGISFSKDSNRGTLLTPWFSVEDVVTMNDSFFIYKDTSGAYHKIFIDEGYDIKIYFDRFIVINTTSFENAYDMKTRKVCHFADDWNNRLAFGREASNTSFIETNNSLSLLLSSAVGEQYTIDDNILCSSILNPIVLKYWNGNQNYFTYKTDSDIDVNIYGSIGTTTYAKYLFSLNRMNRVINSKYIGLNYPVSSSGTLYLNPDLFMRQLRSYTNADLFWENDLAYAVTYYNNKPVFIYNLTSLQSDLSAVFVIQSQRYGVISDKIVSLTYSNNIISGIDTICDVKGLKYIGYLPSAAFFFSKKERKIYQFTGDADLTMLVECTEIDDIYNTYYDTATKTLYWLTKNGFYCFSGDYCWFISSENNEENTIDTFYTTNDDILIKYKNFDTVFLRMEPNNEGYEKLPYEIETSFYGSSENKISKLSNIYIQTLNDFNEPNDTVDITSKSITDTEVKSDVKSFQRKSILEYIPKYDIGIGTSFNIKGTVPIKSIIIDTNEIGASQKTTFMENIR